MPPINSDFNNIENVLQEFNNILSTFTTSLSNTLNILKDINSGLENVARNETNDVKKATTNLTDALEQSANDIKAHNDKQRVANNKAADELEKSANNRSTKLENEANSVVNDIKKTFQPITSSLSNAITNITNVFNTNASRLAASLGSSIDNIHALQSSIRNSINSAGLSSALSSVAVFERASALASAGYTDASTLAANAQAIEAATITSPNIDWNNRALLNLTNVLGSDFANKIAAIQLSTQETAGSTVALKETVSTLLTNLEPVFLVAEEEASQGMSSVSATINEWVESGALTESAAQEYTKLLTELMDPTALESSNYRVRAAASLIAQTSNWQSDNPMDYLEALIAVDNNTAGLVDTNNRVSSAFFGEALGYDSLTYSRLGANYGNLTATYVNDLNETVSELNNKLESGDYTTATERNRNILENADLINQIALVIEDFPVMYQIVSDKIINAIDAGTTKIVMALLSTGGVGSGSSGGGLLNKLFDGKSSSGTTTGDIATASGGGLKSSLGKALKIGSVLGIGLETIQTGLAGYSYENDEDPNTTWSTAITGNSTINEDSSTSDKWSSGLLSAATWAGKGALLGATFGGVGALVGGGIGLLIGAIGGIADASKENSEKLEENTKATAVNTDVTGELVGKTALEGSQADAQAGTLTAGTVFFGNGTVGTISGYADGLGYVPYDNFIARLHKGEAVVTASSANALRQQNPNFWNNSSVISNNTDVVNSLEQQTKSIVNAIHGTDQFNILNTSMKQQTTYDIKNPQLA